MRRSEEESVKKGEMEGMGSSGGGGGEKIGGGECFGGGDGGDG